MMADDCPPLVHSHARHPSGDSFSASASSHSENNENEIANMQAHSSEPDKPKFVLAPPPKVNPWQANANAASVIAKKDPSGFNGIPSTPLSNHHKNVDSTNPLTVHNANGNVRDNSPGRFSHSSKKGNII